MTDHVTKEKRSEIMRAIRGKNTTPEIIVRKLVFSLGYRYRLHGGNLSGKPDLVFPGRRRVIFIHGCFWHYHNCSKGKPPKSNLDYWLPKLKENRRRDVRNQKSILSIGWKFLVIWQCELSDTVQLKKKIIDFLEESNAT
ncbi:very short patch repair endonuclease [Collimonas silvisoli]|uniref:very short patch repair endonuclease n=1 Tax=Collimonas silvisoli TaxID=2825884 RepID=UPI001B8AAE35|nr:very short patch repair endonuclease [Collimonas silvisoli]